MKGDDLRFQNLEIIHVSRLQARNQRQPPSSCHAMRTFPWMSSWRFVTTSAIGWVTLLAMIAMSVILQTYISLTFLILMPVTGSVVFVLYGINPRHLLVNKASDFNRLILVTEHVNSTKADNLFSRWHAIEETQASVAENFLAASMTFEGATVLC
jgi:hypothetical protein